MKWYSPYYNVLVNIINKEGNKDSSEIKKLIDCDRDQFNSNKKTSEENCNYTPLLHMAVACNSQEVVRALLENGADPDVLDQDGQTPLQVAVINDFQEVVRILLKNGADINAQNDKKNTALHLAVSGQNLGMVQILLDNGANSSIENQRGNAPLHVAVNRSLDVKIHTKDIGKSNLSVATVTKQQISDQSNEETTQVIPINIKNLAKIQLNGTFRGYSHNVKNARIIEDLLAHDTNKEPIKALINQSNRDWYYPIHLAVISENLDAAEVLLSDPRIDINAGTGIAEDTALMLATEKDDDDMVKLLLSHDNIDHNICNDYGNTAFELALMNRCSNEIIVTLWRDIEKRIKNKTLKDHSIKLVRGFGMKEELDRIKAEYGIDIKSMVEFIYIPGLEGYGDEELDVSEESEASEHETLENQETEPELEMSDIEVEAGPAAKRQRRG